MAVSRLLFQLQEIDLQIEAKDKAVAKMTAELGESEALREARSRLHEEQKHFNGLSSEQRDLELEIEDLTEKINASEKELYSGRIRVPKELGNLQQEIATLKSRRSGIEDKSLALMEQLESSRMAVSRLAGELRTVEEKWAIDQSELKKNIESEKKALGELAPKRQELARGIEPEALRLYQHLRKQKGMAVARVEQGICRGCRISLPSSELQRARVNLVQCSSCSRILYLP